MKSSTARNVEIEISVPDSLFKAVEHHAKRTKKSRSRLYADAMSEYLMRHASDVVTDAMNSVCNRVGHDRDTFVSKASRRSLGREKW